MAGAGFDGATRLTGGAGLTVGAGRGAGAGSIVGDGDGGQVLDPATDDIDLDGGRFLVLSQGGSGEKGCGRKQEGNFHVIPHGRR